MERRIPGGRRVDAAAILPSLGAMSEFMHTTQVAEARQALSLLKANMRLAVKGKDDVIEHALVCFAAGGHLLIEDLPGLGKTTLAYSLARSMDCSFSRIQFTSDLLPSDVTGVAIYDEHVKEFVFKPGPIFANIVLADEINRATPKTQSALLEVMDRGKVTIDGEAHAVGAPFMVLATQNPVDYEGTFPLPESQMDRFLMRIRMGYPKTADELEILRAPRMTYDSIQLNPVVMRTYVLKLQQLVTQVFVEESVLDFILKIIAATRTEAEFEAGVSVRGGLSLKLAAQARALLNGRDFVVPEDVLDLVQSVLGHRLSLVRQTSDALEERNAIAAVLRKITASIPAPV
jgi:MoxR-like ATPase